MSAYSKNRAVEQIWLKITGGKTDPDSDVLKADIESYLPSAINYVIGEDLKSRRFGKQFKNFSHNDILINQTYSPTFDTTRNAYKIDLDFIIPSYSGVSPLVVMPLQGGSPFAYLASRGDLQGLEEVMSNTTYVWLERSLTGHTIYFGNLLCNECSVVVQTACDYDSLSSDVILPVPDNLWVKIFEICDIYFTKQRTTATNETVDGTDENK